MERQNEINSHISVDLNKPDAVSVIEAISGGNFILVTSANLGAGGFRGDEEAIAGPLMQIGGIYAQFEASPRYEIKDKQGRLERV